MKALLLVSLMLYPVQDGYVTINASTMQEVIEVMEALDKVNKDQGDEIKFLRKVLDLKQACA